jgi:hypothetical protein
MNNKPADAPEDVLRFWFGDSWPDDWPAETATRSGSAAAPHWTSRSATASNRWWRPRCAVR